MDTGHVRRGVPALRRSTGRGRGARPSSCPSSFPRVGCRSRIGRRGPVDLRLASWLGLALNEMSVLGQEIPWSVRREGPCANLAAIPFAPDNRIFSPRVVKIPSVHLGQKSAVNGTFPSEEPSASRCHRLISEHRVILLRDHTGLPLPKRRAPSALAGGYPGYRPDKGGEPLSVRPGFP